MKVATMRTALLVGGHAGFNSYDRLIERLRKEWGIEVTHHRTTREETRRPLPKVDLVLLSTDVCSHGMSDNTQKAIRDRALGGYGREPPPRLVLISRKWVTTRLKLEEAGIPAMPRKVSKAPKPKPKPVPTPTPTEWAPSDEFVELLKLIQVVMSEDGLDRIELHADGRVEVDR